MSTVQYVLISSFSSEIMWQQYREKLSQVIAGNILVVGELNLWSGKKTVFHILRNKKFIDLFNTDYEATWFVNGSDLIAEVTHHDGKNTYKFRKLKNLTVRQFRNLESKIETGSVSDSVLAYYTEPLGKDVLSLLRED